MSAKENTIVSVMSRIIPCCGFCGENLVSLFGANTKGKHECPKQPISNQDLSPKPSK